MPLPPSLPMTNAAAPAPQRASKPVPSPGRTASDAITSATRAVPAATASTPAPSASMPAWAEPALSVPEIVRAQPNAAAKNAKLGPSAKGGRLVPQNSPSTASGSIPQVASFAPATWG